jgi:O-antigen/teichoic acid export membrane protein
VRLMTTFLTIILARSLGTDGYGLLSYAIAFSGLMSVVAEFGFEAIIVREVSARREALRELPVVLGLKMSLAVLGGLVIIGSGFVLGDGNIRFLIFLFAFFTSIKSVCNYYRAIFLGLQRMEYVGLLSVFETTVLLCVCGSILLFNQQVVLIGCAYLCASILLLVLSVYIARAIGVGYKPRLDITISLRYLKMAWPLAFSSVFSTIYIQIAAVMMGSLNMMAEVGLYSASYKIASVIIVPANIIAMVFYPTLSQSYVEDKDKFYKILNVVFEILVFLALPLILLSFVFSREILWILYGQEYLAAENTLRALLCSSGLIFFILLINAILNSIGQQKAIFKTSVVAAIANVGLCWVLIPTYSYYGAGLASALTYLIILLARFAALYREKIVPNIKLVIAPIIASGFMLVLLESSWSSNILLLRIGIASVAYLCIWWFARFALSTRRCGLEGGI